MKLGRHARPQRIAVIAFSDLAQDSRVTRTIQALSDAGHQILAIGFGDAPREASVFVRLPRPARGWPNRIGMALRHAPAAVLPELASILHDLAATNRAARRALCDLQPDIVHANDWPTLPAALAAKATCGAAVVYDSHEFATEEHAHRRQWRLLMQSHVGVIEARSLGRVDRVITVSYGIAQALAERYRLTVVPIVIRNVPRYEPQPFRAMGKPRHLLFHGVLKDYRGNEAIVDALAKLPGYVLTLRGDATPTYLAKLDARIRGNGV
ncbi:MAG: glycosyltransferase, partial [Acetobacteraceae bacterium]|nr:glycosyltransferase [Acetobacteraceae bacterium]